MQTNRVDVMYVHDARTPEKAAFAGAYEAFQELHDAGKIGYYGLSTHLGQDATVLKCVELGWYSVLMVAWNFFSPPSLTDTLKAAADKGGDFRFLYPLEASIKEKIETIAMKIYGADGVDYLPEAEAKMGLKNTCVLPKSEGFDFDVYICWNIQSALDPTSAPTGKYLYTGYLPLTEKEATTPELVKKIVARLPEFMEEVYPGFKASMDWKLDVVCWKLEGVAKSISQAGTQKVPVKSEHVRGLYFAGDTARGYGVAMDCAIVSGMICAGEILGKDFGFH